jgi:hypothetical protein
MSKFKNEEGDKDESFLSSDPFQGKMKKVRLTTKIISSDVVTILKGLFRYSETKIFTTKANLARATRVRYQDYLFY